LRQLYTLQKRVRAWRQQAVQRLIGEVSGLASYGAPNPGPLDAGNILVEAVGKKLREATRHDLRPRQVFAGPQLSIGWTPGWAALRNCALFRLRTDKLQARSHTEIPRFQ
jgi:hypothetical protein